MLNASTGSMKMSASIQRTPVQYQRANFSCTSPAAMIGNVAARTSIAPSRIIISTSNPNVNGTALNATTISNAIPVTPLSVFCPKSACSLRPDHESTPNPAWMMPAAANDANDETTDKIVSDDPLRSRYCAVPFSRANNDRVPLTAVSPICANPSPTTRNPPIHNVIGKTFPNGPSGV